MVRNEQRLNKKSRWSAEAFVPSDIYEQFDKKPEKKRFEFDLINLFNDQQKQQFNDYIRRSFDKCQNAKEQQLMTSMLLTNLTTLIYKRSLESIKWDTYYLPLLPREKDRPVNQFNPNLAFATQQPQSMSYPSSYSLGIPGYSAQAASNIQHQQQQQQEQSLSLLNKDSFQQQSDLKSSQHSLPFQSKPTNILPFSISTQPLPQNTSNPYNNNNSYNHSYNNNKSNNNVIQKIEQHPSRTTNNFGGEDQVISKSNSNTNQKRQASIDLNKIVKNPKENKQLKMENKLQLQQQLNPSNSQPLQIQMSSTDNEQDLEQLVTKWNIVGTCTDIEKPYLRLTKEPSADQVRPEEVLKKSLKFLMGKWKESDCDYSYIQSQFRSIRQDLIIQHIRNEFTAKVCEYNARICLEVDDIPQYVQCCATLFDLYHIGIRGQREEFYCYKIIDSALSAKTSFELPKLIFEVSSFIDHPLIQFAIEFQPKISLEELCTMLKFDDLSHVKEFVQSAGGVLDESGNEVLLKESCKGFLDTYHKI